MGQTFCSQSACAPEASRTYRAVVCASLGSPAIKERGAGIPHTSLSLSYICIYIYINIYIPVHMEILLPLPLLDWQDGANKPEEGQPSAAQAP